MLALDHLDTGGFSKSLEVKLPSLSVRARKQKGLETLPCYANRSNTLLTTETPLMQRSKRCNGDSAPVDVLT
jgi:hypothetical protein